MRPRLLDLCCGPDGGGASMGYYLVGFDVVGVDIAKRGRYPFPYFQADALEFVAEFGQDFAAIHASFPCQAFSGTQRIQGNEHPDLITPGRDLLNETGVPWVMENVEGAPLIEPIMLCGAMFGLRTYRHRLFETSFHVEQPPHPEHEAPQAKMGRPVKDGEFMHVVGNFSGADLGRKVMGMPWATRDGLREAIPPAYTVWIGALLLEHLAYAPEYGSPSSEGVAA